MTDDSAQFRFKVDLNNLLEAKQIIKSIQRDCRAALRALAVLESLDKEEDNADKRQRHSD